MSAGKGPVIIYCRGGGRRIFGGSLDFEENKRGDQSKLRTQKGGFTDNFGRIQRGDHSNLLGK